MRKFLPFVALALALSFGTVTSLAFAGDPPPTEKKEEKKGGGKLQAGDEKKEEKKGDKGGK
jgi:hypothetical protein